jgi:carbonic anhydrase/acetyltransferase-like protein (isoleucine patch superfamily)
MLIANQKPIKIVGYPQGSMTFEFLSEISRDHYAELMPVYMFFELEDKTKYQYIVSETMLSKRKPIVDYIDQHDLDLVTYIHDSVVLANFAPPNIGAGTFIFPLTSILSNSNVGRHSIIGSHCHIGHYCNVGNNCQLRPGCMITGKSSIGNNCMLNTGVAVTNKAIVADDIELMAFSQVVKNLTEPGKYLGRIPKRVEHLASPNDL